MSRPCDLLVLGGGFAGTLLARLARCLGLRVTVLERQAHPRFAIGESSTPLANLALERIAARYRLDDLWQLAAWGRWRRFHPELRCGLKRGFSFFRHRPAEPYRNGPTNDSRLLVAASPDDRVADSHWLRADLDQFLARRAQGEGALCLEETRILGLERRRGLWRAEVESPAGRQTHTAPLVVDATGAAGALAACLELPAGPPLRTRSGLTFGHYRGVCEFAPIARRGGAGGDAEPYPPDRAALHHLLDEGWIYVLRFDDGLVSAGLLRAGGLPPGETPTTVWEDTLERYPSIGEQFRAAQPVRPAAAVPQLQYRRGAVAGPGWVQLPHAYAFVDPLFSSGIAWSLLAIERLAEVLAHHPPASDAVASGEAFGRYGELLHAESEQLDRLIAGAYAALPDFSTFTYQSWLYFAWVSFAEARQRLLDLDDPAWEGLLGGGDADSEAVFEEAWRRLSDPGRDADSFAAWVRSAVEPRDLLGLGRAQHPNCYPVDTRWIVERAGLLGMTPAEATAALPRLRGLDVEVRAPRTTSRAPSRP